MHVFSVLRIFFSPNWSAEEPRSQLPDASLDMKNTRGWIQGGSKAQFETG